MNLMGSLGILVYLYIETVEVKAHIACVYHDENKVMCKGESGDLV